MATDQQLRDPLFDGDGSGVREELQTAADAPKPWSVRREWCALVGVSIPIAVATVARVAIGFTDTAFVGHLGTISLSASLLALNWSAVLNDLMWSAGYALNSLCAQAIGAHNFHMAGEWLQLAVVTTVALALLCISGYFFTDYVVAAVENSTAVVQRSLEFNVFATLYVIPTALYLAIRQFFQALQVVIPATIVSIVSIGFNVGMNQLFVHGFVLDPTATNVSDSLYEPAGALDSSSSSSSSSSRWLFPGGASGMARVGARAPVVSSAAVAAAVAVDPNRTWPWPAGQDSFPVYYQNDTFAGFGLVGSPLATTVSTIFQLVCFCVFCFTIKKYHAKYWGGWSRDAFTAKRWRQYFKIIIPMTIGNCVEDWGYQILAYLSGALGAEDVAAIGVMVSIWGILWAVYWGFGLGLQVRVGFHLGDGQVDRAKKVALISFYIVVSLVGVLAGASYFLRYILMGIFTTDPGVIARGADAMFLLCIAYFLSCTQICASNIMQGTSRNTSMAVVQGIGSWVVHVPLTVYLMLFCPAFETIPVYAFWVGSSIAEGAKSVAMWVLVLTTDWEHQAQLARERSESVVALDDDDDADDGLGSGAGGDTAAAETGGKLLHAGAGQQGRGAWEGEGEGEAGGQQQQPQHGEEQEAEVLGVVVTAAV